VLLVNRKATEFALTTPGCDEEDEERVGTGGGGGFLDTDGRESDLEKNAIRDSFFIVATGFTGVDALSGGDLQGGSTIS